ncbi:MAG: 1-acyl-sn-glycerol-3-phosphate acyltransferase, partial [Planctomycetes bacterium]|nr:1-acyl-sn-glycerol-3-phosphate acyltransferase [Planctomycetota bacterium]
TPKGFFTPFRMMPWSVADKENYYDPWYWRPLRFARLIPIRRNKEGERSDSTALRKMLRVIQQRQNLMVFPEGTRTAKTTRRHRISGGRALGYFRPGIEFLMRHAASEFLPVWIEGTDKIMPVGSLLPRLWKSRITIVVGEPFTYNKDDLPKDANDRRYLLEKRLLDLAETIRP